MNTRIFFRLFLVVMVASLLAGTRVTSPAAQTDATPTPPNPFEGVTLQPVWIKAKVLSPSLVAQMIPVNKSLGIITAADLNRTGGMIEFENVTLSELQIAQGAILVTGISETTPYGLLQRVTDVQDTLDGVTLQTVQATIEEAVENVDVTANGSRLVASMRPITRQSAGGGRMMVDPALARGEIKITLQNQNLGNQVTANGEIVIKPDFYLHMKINNFKMEKFTFIDKTSIKANIKLSSGTGGKKTLSKSIYKYEFPTVNISPLPGLPIPLTPVLQVFVGVNGQVFAGITTEGIYTNRAEIRTDWEKGKWSFTKNLNDKFEYKPPSVSAKVSAKVFTRPCLELMLFGVVGPYAQVEGYYRLEASPLKDPCWFIYGGVLGEVGVKLEIFQFIKSVSYTPVYISKEREIAHAVAKASQPQKGPSPDPLPTKTSPPKIGSGAATSHPPAGTGNENVLLVYDPKKAVLVNLSTNPISLQGLTFIRVNDQGTETASFNSDIWENLASAGRFDALPYNDCMMISTRASGIPPQCSSVWGYFTTSQSKFYFWQATGDSSQFQVWWNNALLQTCNIPAGTCAFYLPSSR